MRESQYDRCVVSPPVTIGAMVGQKWQDDPKGVLFTLARYKVVSRLLEGMGHVAEVGCGDGFAGRLVEQTVGKLWRFDFDSEWCRRVLPTPHQPQGAECRDIEHEAPYLKFFDAVYALDVLEHIGDVDAALRNMCHGLVRGGTLVIGMPSLESQAYASEQSRAGHVSCMSGDALKALLLRYMRTVFVLGMNDEVAHFGFLPMSHYLIGIGVGVRDEHVYRV